MGDTHVVLGVDGGNSKTIALVARPDGAIIGWGRSGVSDIYGVSEGDALAEVRSAVYRAADMAGVGPDEIESGVFSMAGADWPEDLALLTEAFHSEGLARRVRVVNDAMGALRAGSWDGTGVAVVCGTGAAIGARNIRGDAWHTGWWQEPQGSRHLAQQALRAVYRAELGIDSPTSLTRRVLAIYAVETVGDVLHRLTARNRSGDDRRPAVASALLEEAEGGDETASAIVWRHGAALGDYASSAAREVQLEGSAFRLVLAGGVLRHGGWLLRDAIVERVRERSPEVMPVLSPFEPVVGAVFLALEESGVHIDEAVRGRIRESMPLAELFAR